MHDIDQAAFHFSATAGIAVAVMVGFLVFAVALDLKWEQFGRVLRNPRAPLTGLLAQFAILPAIAFVVGRLIVDVPSVALGLLLVASCPGGAPFSSLASSSKDQKAESPRIGPTCASAGLPGHRVLAQVEDAAADAKAIAGDVEEVGPAQRSALICSMPSAKAASVAILSSSRRMLASKPSRPRAEDRGW